MGLLSDNNCSCIVYSLSPKSFGLQTVRLVSITFRP